MIRAIFTVGVGSTIHFMMHDNFNYSETYFEGLLTGWNKVSYPLISKFAKTSLEKYKPDAILDLGCGSGIYFELFKNYTKNRWY